MVENKHDLLGAASSRAFFHPKFNVENEENSSPAKVKLSPELRANERGAVVGIASYFRNAVGGAAIEGRDNDEGIIKVALLFNDRLDKPGNNLIKRPEDIHNDLTGIGFGSKSEAIFKSGLSYAQMSKYVWEVYELLDEREPGLWSLWPQRNNPIIPEDLLSPDQAFRLDLNKGLIVPHPSTPYEDVVAFKERHRDELISFRHHLEEFAIKLSKEGDPRTVHLELERFDRSLSEYLKKARQSNVRKVVASLTTELDWTAAARSIISGGGSGGLLAVAQGFSLGQTAACVGGGLLAGLSLKSTHGLVREASSPFRYIAQINSEYGD